jgi:hypothetical protein
MEINRTWKPFLQVAQKGSDARRPKFLGMRRSLIYVGMTRDEGNAADGPFSDTC